MSRTKTLMFVAAVFLHICTSSKGHAEYLGRLGSNPFCGDCTANPFARVVNPFYGNSLTNPFGPYGNPFSPYSANNPFATETPRIYGDAAPDEYYADPYETAE